MTFLILGGTGTTGRRIANQLKASGHQVRTASRTGSDVPLDLDHPTTWPAALDNITAAYVMEPTVRAGDRLARFIELAL
ncbi:NAD-dependent epimerase/dehydratase family protein [Kribbella sp. NPDC026611]|uniref:NAD-dependent epimerase/dehydratase family protein n=1 Tax=Kribbella sp. NPDC026611 TaxID=3154911 RepID=UPI0033F8C2F3